MRTLLRPALALALATAALSVHAVTLTQYNVPGSAFTPTTTAAGLTATAFNTTGSTATLEAAFSGEGVFLRQTVGATTPAAAVAAAQYFQFTVTPNAGLALNLASLVFDAARGGTSTPRGFVVRSSRDAFATDVATISIATVEPTYTNFNIDLTGPTFQGLATATTFRIYDYVPEAGNGIFYDNLTLSGTITPVPEPSAIAALGLGAVAVLRRRARKA